MSGPPCGAPTRAGTACRGFALPGLAHCINHAPEAAERIRAARSKGAKVRVLMGRRRRLERPAELARFLSTLIEDTLAGRVDAGVARSVGYCAQVLRGVVETSDLAERLERLEAQLAARGGKRWG